MDKNEALIIAIIVALICAFGWYSSSNNAALQTDAKSSSETSIGAYQGALQEANENIEQVNECVHDAYDAFDSGYFDEGISTLDACEAETVSEP